MIRLRVEAPFTSYSPPPHIILSHTRVDTPPSGTPPSGTPLLLPIPLPTSSPSLLLPFADNGANMPEVCLPPWKRLCFAFGPRYEVRESLSAAAARLTKGFRADYGFVATMDRKIRHDLERDVVLCITDNIVNAVVQAKGTHELMTIKTSSTDGERGRMLRDWDDSHDASDLARSEVMSLRTTVLGQHVAIIKLQAADHRRQAAIIELLAADRKR
ncbi:hypothetical protein Tco_0421576 [Tanacetum coccineum]